jgi:hypothetical protein
VERAIREAGGWVTDFRQFSNFAVVLEIQIPAGRLASLPALIEAEGISLSPPVGETPDPERGVEEVTGTLRIEFLHDEPDLRIEVPAVPG